MMKTKIRWGIISTGNIANQMAKALKLVDNAEITCVLSRNTDSAKAFAKKYRIPDYFSDRDKFAEYKNVDVVYIASVHPAHYTDTLLCLNSGKHVLCEKPMALNKKQVSEMIECAKTNKLFLMEAMWSAFFPAYQKAMELIKMGEIGEIRHISASFAFKAAYDPKGRWFDPKQGGGALLDVGIYPLYFATMMMGDFPISAKAMASFASTDVDDHSSYLLHYKNGATANLNSGLTYNSNHEGIIYGTNGYIKLDAFWRPNKCFLYKNGKKKKFKFKVLGNGYPHEAMHVTELIRKGETESPVITHQHSLMLAELMDSFRKKWNFKYPDE